MPCLPSGKAGFPAKRMYHSGRTVKSDPQIPTRTPEYTPPSLHARLRNHLVCCGVQRSWRRCRRSCGPQRRPFRKQGAPSQPVARTSDPRALLLGTPPSFHPHACPPTSPCTRPTARLPARPPAHPHTVSRYRDEQIMCSEEIHVAPSVHEKTRSSAD